MVKLKVVMMVTMTTRINQVVLLLIVMMIMMMIQQMSQLCSISMHLRFSPSTSCSELEDAGSRHSSGNDCDDYVGNHGDDRGACNVFIMRGFLNVKDVNPQISVNFSKIQFNMLCKFKAKSLLLYDDSDDDAAVAAGDGGDDEKIMMMMVVTTMMLMMM